MSGTVRKCDSDNKWGQRCHNDARYPWRKPRLCGQHWTHGEHYRDPIVTKPRKQRQKPLPSETHLCLRVLIGRLDRLLKAGAEIECMVFGCTKNAGKGKTRCEPHLKKMRAANRRLRTLRLKRGECTRPGCVQAPAVGQKMCARHQGISRSVWARRARAKRRERHGRQNK